jgi:hypothetical protein
MGREYNRRKREQRELDQQPLAHRRLEERAVREGWLSEGKERSRIISRLLGALDDDETETRYLVGIAKTLVYADLGQQRLDFAKQQHADHIYSDALIAAAAERPAAKDGELDLEVYRWFDDSCPCSLPAGDCLKHPRARAAQRPPLGDWRVWLVLAGRGFGKTRTGAEWVKQQVESGKSKRIAMVAPTAADVRDVMLEGESGILAVSSPDFMPVYEPSKRKLTWPNGARAYLYSADEPERLRGPQHDDAWLDELGSWRRPEAFDMLMFGLRLGDDPRACVTTTPKSTKLIKDLIAHPKTIKTGGSTYDNKVHLAANFFENVISSYEGTRLGRQEIYAEVLELTEGVWFKTFNPGTHVTELAEHHVGYPVHLAIDCGTSQHTGAVWFQVRQLTETKFRVTVFADFISSGSFSAKNAVAIKEQNSGLTSVGRLDLVRVDPASKAHTGIGPAAYTEYEKVFGRLLAKWPAHGVVDGLELLEILLEAGCLWIHPRCVNLIESFKNYKRKEVAGVVINYPADNQSPHEDMMDALRGGVRDRFPAGQEPPKALRPMHASRIT